MPDPSRFVPGISASVDLDGNMTIYPDGVRPVEPVRDDEPVMVVREVDVAAGRVVIGLEAKKSKEDGDAA